MRYIANIFVFYIALLTILPALPYCDVTNQQNRNTKNCQGDEHGDERNNLCSPFCGEDECGVVILKQVELHPSVVLPIVVVERSDLNIKLYSCRSRSIWHPPKA